MSKENKNLNKKPKLSPYWIYGMVIAAFFAVQIFSGGFGGQDTKKTTPSQFFEYLSRGDVSKVEKIIRVVLTVFISRRLYDEFIHHFVVIEPLDRTVILIRKKPVLNIHAIEVGLADPGNGGMDIVHFIQAVGNS